MTTPSRCSSARDLQAVAKIAGSGSGVQTVEQSIPDAPGWTVTAQAVVEDGQVHLIELTLRRTGAMGGGPTPFTGVSPMDAAAKMAGETSPAASPGITATMLRRIRVDELVGAANRALLDVVDLRNERPVLRSTPRSDVELAVWAARYVEQLAKGSRRPTAELARIRRLAPEQVRDIIHACRERGLLTAAPRGRPGGQLTDHAKALLEPKKGRR